MGTVHGTRRKRKRKKGLGEARVVTPEEYGKMALSAKVELIGISFKTTNCIESVNSLIEERCGKVDAWRNSNQKHRWLAAALLDIEPRLSSRAQV